MKNSTRRKPLLLFFAIFCSVVTVNLWLPPGGVYFFITDTLTSSESLKRAVMSGDPYEASDAYSRLRRRRSDIARDVALEHLRSADWLLWVGAARYLGQIGDPASVPYLIKHLRHGDRGCSDHTANVLTNLTGEDFGTDYDRWRQWWLTENPESQFNWDSHLDLDPRFIRLSRQQQAASEADAATGPNEE